MELKDMKLTRDGKEESVVIALSEALDTDLDRERYPYGLRLSLDREALEKLGIKATGFEPGKTFKLVAKAEVESVNIHKRKGKSEAYGGTSVELQITELGLEPQDDFGTAFAEAVDE